MCPNEDHSGTLLIRFDNNTHTHRITIVNMCTTSARNNNNDARVEQMNNSPHYWKVSIHELVIIKW